MRQISRKNKSGKKEGIQKPQKWWETQLKNIAEGEMRSRTQVKIMCYFTSGSAQDGVIKEIKRDEYKDE